MGAIICSALPQDRLERGCLGGEHFEMSQASDGGQHTKVPPNWFELPPNGHN